MCEVGHSEIQRCSVDQSFDWCALFASKAASRTTATNAGLAHTEELADPRQAPEPATQ